MKEISKALATVEADIDPHMHVSEQVGTNPSRKLECKMYS